MSLRAQATNTLEIIQRLQKQVEELQQRVKTLESEKAAAAPTNVAPSQQRLEQLDQQVKSLQRERELDAEAAAVKVRNAPRIVLGEQGFSFTSADTNFAVQLKGVLQVDSRTFFQDAGIVGNDGFVLRRARPVLQGTVFRDFDFLFVPDFGTANNGGNGGTAPTPQIFDVYVNYRYSPALQLQAGKFKSPIGLEQLQADRDITFNERALPTDLVPTRDLGFELHGDLLQGVVSYAAGIFNGVGDARNSSLSALQDDKAFEGRIFFQPFKKASVPALAGFGFGLGGSYQDMQGANTAGLPNNNGYATVGQQQFFAYIRLRESAQPLVRRYQTAASGRRQARELAEKEDLRETVRSCVKNQVWPSNRKLRSLVKAPGSLRSPKLEQERRRALAEEIRSARSETGSSPKVRRVSAGKAGHFSVP